MPARSRLCRLTLASSPTLYRWRSARSRSLVSSFLPEIVSTRSATIGLPNRSVPATRTMYRPPCESSTRKRERSAPGLRDRS